MTNALTQNIENNIDTVITSMVNLETNNKSNSQIDCDSTFSNLLNCASANIEKTQTNFIDRAVKSNTSSINKLALSTTKKSENTSKKDFKISSNDTNLNVGSKKGNVLEFNSSKQKNITNNTYRNANSTDKVTEEKNILVKENIGNSFDKDKISNNSSDIKEDTENINNDSNNLSDINNSSFVEPSPVVSFEEKEITASKDISNIDLMLSNTNEIQNLTSLLQSQVSSDETLMQEDNSDILSIVLDEQVDNQIVDSISENLNENTSYSSDNQDETNISDSSQHIDKSELKQDFSKAINEKMNEVFEKADLEDLNKTTEQNDIQNINLKSDSEDEISLLINENEINEVISENNIDNKLNNEIVSELNISEEQNEIVNVELNNEDIKKINSLKNINNEINKEKNEAISEITEFDENKIESEDKTVLSIDENKNNINTKFIVNDNETNINDNKLNEKTNYIADELKTEAYSNDDENNTKINKTVSDIEENLNKFFVSEDNREVVSDEKVSETIKNFEEIVKVLPDSDLKKEINNIIETLSEKSKDAEIEQNDIKDTIASLVDDIKNYVNDFKNNVKSASQNEKQTGISDITDSDVNESENILVKNIERNSSEQNLGYQQNSKNQAEEFDFQNNEEILKDYSVDENLAIKNSDVEISNENIENIKTTKIENEVKIEENLQKVIYTQELLDEMVENADISFISEQSCALTVSDEVAKLAMDSVNSLTSGIQGSAIYDSASGNGTLIKNAASLSKMTQTQEQAQEFKMSDVMNQIGDKLEQLKNGQGQKLTMVLRPNDLGRLSLELTSNNLGLTTNIMAQNEDVRSYIEKNIDVLKQQLFDAGIKVNTIQIRTVGQSEATSYEGNQNFSSSENSNQENLNEQNQNNQQQNSRKKEERDIFANVNNYDMYFAKDFSTVFNKAINYGVN